MRHFRAAIALPLRRLWALLLLAAVLPTFAGAQSLDLDIGSNDPVGIELDDELNQLASEQGQGVGTLFQLVPFDAPDESLSPRTFWREHEGKVAAGVAAARVIVGEHVVIEPKTIEDPYSGELRTIFPSSGRKSIPNGSFVLRPGNVPLVHEGGTWSSDHPAVSVKDDIVRIRCSPVRLSAIDSSGAPVEAEFLISADGGQLLREQRKYRPLIVWLPVGGAYKSSLGSFLIDANGRFNADQDSLAPNVSVQPDGLQITIDGSKPSADAIDPSFAAREVIAVGDAAIAIYVQRVIQVGQPLLIAINLRDAPREMQNNLKPEIFITDAGARGAAAQPNAEVASTAARALGVNASSLAWVALPAAEAAGTSTMRVNIDDMQAGITIDYYVRDTAPTPGTLIAPRHRSVFCQSEKVVFQLLLPNGFRECSAKVMASPVGGGADASPQQQLGTLQLPDVSGAAFDSRAFKIDFGALPAGRYNLSVVVDSAIATSEIEVVAMRQRSPFFVHTMSCCTPGWPQDEQGLALLADAGLQMLTATAHRSDLDDSMPLISDKLALSLQAAGLPGELALMRTNNDRLLERILRNRLRLVDLTVARAANFYNEGLSYHHSYGPSIDRMIRRMQIFTQQTGDYPSFWGVNYSWFPQQFGYVEGGVATDAHVAARNAALNSVIKAAGLEPFTREQRRDYLAQREEGRLDASAGLTAGADRDIDHWRKQFELGFGRHNELYNNAVREVRPRTATLLFENAGHDVGKATDYLFNDMTAAAYETYTDYGDWPMSSGFTTDWARSYVGNKPVWITTSWGTSTEGKAKSLLHGMARGLDGGGVPMQATAGLDELARRGKILRFAELFGPVATSAQPDRQVAILATLAKQRLTQHGMYDYHAIYSHLTRLGWPPIVVQEHKLDGDSTLDGVKLLVLVQEEDGFTADALAAIKAFQSAGGKVVQIGKSAQPIDGAIAVPQPVESIWDGHGFLPASHEWLWQQFELWRQPLGEAMTSAGITPRAAAEPGRAFVMTSDAGAVRYAFVVADRLGKHSNVFAPEREVAISLERTGWHVRDLTKQISLEVSETEGRTNVLVDLVAEPVAVLALTRDEPAEVVLSAEADMSRSQPMLVQADVLDSRGASMGPVPVKWQLMKADGRVIDSWVSAAGATCATSVALLDPDTEFRLTAQELLTGRRAEATIRLEQKAAESVVRQLPDVHVADERQLRMFAAKPGEKLVILEQSQSHVLPQATMLIEKLKAAGVDARLWLLRPEDFDTHPLRWVLRKEDERRLELIAQGRLIGYRKNLKAEIDMIARKHVPERGGYATINPAYMIGKDCIVFSGGEIADSLQQVTAWMNTPHTPGVGQARLVVAFSPFTASNDALAVVGNDAVAIERAVDQVVAAFRDSENNTDARRGEGDPFARYVTSVEGRPLKRLDAKMTTDKVATPMQLLSPLRRVEALHADQQGNLIVEVAAKQPLAVMVDNAGVVTGAAPLRDGFAGHAQQGGAWLLHRRGIAGDLRHGQPRRIAINLLQISAAGQVVQTLPAYTGDASLPPGWQGGFDVVAGSEGQSLALISRPGIALMGKPGDVAWTRYDDLPNTSQRYSILFPRSVVGSAFSPDGKYVCITLDTRPPINSMSGSVGVPAYNQTLLIDTQTGGAVWSRTSNGDWPKKDAAFVAHDGFAAVAREGARTAILDYDGGVHIITREGKPLLSRSGGQHRDEVVRLGPINGVGVGISDAGDVAAFAFADRLIIASAKGDDEAAARDLDASQIVSVCVSRDGSRVYVGHDGGTVTAYSALGEELWQKKLGLAGIVVAAAGESGVIAANGSGGIHWLDASGESIRQVQLPDDDALLAQATPADQTSPVRLPAPDDYRRPSTLSIAQKHLNAKRLAHWSPSGDTREAYGMSFAPLTKPVALEAEGQTAFVRAVYRQVEFTEEATLSQEQAPVIVTRGGPSAKTSHTFKLDLPTPHFREVIIPVDGPKAVATFTPKPGVELATFELWSVEWPGSNVAYVKPAGKEIGGNLGSDLNISLDGDLMGAIDLQDGAGSAGAMKDAKIYWPNSDPDTVRGAFMPSQVNPLQMVDQKRFEDVKPWTGLGRYRPAWGGSFTLKFDDAIRFGLVATYERTTVQSEVNKVIYIFSGPLEGRHDSPPVLAATIDNDQFWRLFVMPDQRVQVLGVSVFAAEDQVEGLSEVEAYLP